MALSRTTMTPEEATTLAARIDKSRLAVHVKRVTNDGIVEVQDDQTGYILPIMSPEHWQQYERQVGGSHAADDFANAGVQLLATLDKILEGMRFERDNLLQQAEQVDNQIGNYQRQRDTIEAAISAAGDVAILATLKRGVTAAPVPVTPAEDTRPIKRTKQPANMPTQGEWIVNKLHQDGRIKISILAVEMTRHYPITKGRAATNISGEMSRQMKANPNIKRIAPGEFVLVIEGTMPNG